MGYTNYFNVSSEYIETNLNVIAIDLICFSLFLMGMYILDYFLKFQFERIRIDFYKSVIVIDIILNSYLFSGVIVIIEIMLLSNLNFIVPIVSTILMMIGQGIVLYRNNSRWFYNNSETIFSFSSKYIIRSVESFIVMFIYFFINPQYRKEVSNIQYGWVLTILFVLWISVFSSLIATIFEQRMNGNEWINKTENTDFSSIFKHTDSSAILRRLLAGLVVLIITLLMSVFSTFGNLFARYTFPKRYTVYQVDNVIAQFFGGSNETSKKTFSKDKEETQQMRELAKRFIGKECIVYSFNSQTFDGTLTEVTDGALVLTRKDGTEEAINLDFVIRIREYPRKKNGKKKDVVID
jgi:hypothetical protein